MEGLRYRKNRFSPLRMRFYFTFVRNEGDAVSLPLRTRQGRPSRDSQNLTDGINPKYLFKHEETGGKLGVLSM